MANGLFQQHDPAVFIQSQNYHSNPMRPQHFWIRELNLMERD
jgi:hypothetical protein